MFKQIGTGVFFAILVGFIAGCTAMDPTSTMSGSIFDIQGGALQARELAPGDGIEVSVEVDGTMEVSSHRTKLNHQGGATLPLVGDVEIGGLKLSTARDRIAETYGAYYVNPPVVMLTFMDGNIEGEWGFVTVLGRVNKPGRVPLQSQKGMNLSAAIQMAGGFATSAKSADVRVSRTDELGMKTQVSVDFREIGQEGNTEADITLINGDIVYVPERIF